MNRLVIIFGKQGILAGRDGRRPGDPTIPAGASKYAGFRNSIQQVNIRVKLADSRKVTLLDGPRFLNFAACQVLYQFGGFVRMSRIAGNGELEATHNLGTAGGTGRKLRYVKTPAHLGAGRLGAAVAATPIAHERSVS